jgi:hypothetical protein
MQDRIISDINAMDAAIVPLLLKKALSECRVDASLPIRSDIGSAIITEPTKNRNKKIANGILSIKFP